MGCTVNIYINILTTIEPAITLTDSTNGGRVLLTSGERCTETPDFITWLWHCLYWMDDSRGVARQHFTPMTSTVTWKSENHKTAHGYNYVKSSILSLSML